MLTTHNFRTLNPSFSQTPLCQALESFALPTFISSATTNLRRMVWPDSSNGQPSPIDIANATAASSYYAKHRKLPLRTHRDTDLIDPMLHQLLLYAGAEDMTKKFYSVSSALSSGLLHEIACRSVENEDVRLSTQQIEINPDRFSQHGQLITEHRGNLHAFILPRVDPISKPSFETTGATHLVLEFELSDFNVATGMVGIGLPPITTIGIFVANFLQRNMHPQQEFQFALGFKCLAPPTKQLNHLGMANPDLQSSRKSNLSGYLVIRSDDVAQLDLALEKLSGDFKFPGGRLQYKNVYLSDAVPTAYWMHDMHEEISSYLNANPTHDALDAAFSFAGQQMYSIPVATGFAFLESPKEKPYMGNMYHPHTWAEVLFRSTELRCDALRPAYFYKRVYDTANKCIYWAQRNSA